jgi:Flp pilus assembly CpaE family ATPase
VNWLNSLLPQPGPSAKPTSGEASNGPARRVSLGREVVEAIGTLTGLQSAFPDVEFVVTGDELSNPTLPRNDIIIISLSRAQTPAVIARIRARPNGMEIIVVLTDGDIESTRSLLRAGVADVIPFPASENALALSIDRALMQRQPAEARPNEAGQVIVFLKGGGGVGATSLCLLTAIHMARERPDSVAVADLDLQSGVVSAQLGLTGAYAISDLLAAGGAISETPFVRALHAHPGGFRVLAGPGEIMPTDSIAPSQADQIMRGLKRDFPITLVDLPSTWSAWTYRIVQQADRIVLVTQLSIPRINLARRQLAMLAAQGLGQKPVTLVCNAVSSDQSDRLPLKWAEKSLGRAFDFAIPEDRRAMDAFINEGIPPSSRGSSSKLHAAIERLITGLNSVAIVPLTVRNG